jgi:hypothetical protein
VVKRKPTPVGVAAVAAVEATHAVEPLVNMLGVWAEASPNAAVRDARLNAARAITAMLKAHTEVEATILVAYADSRAHHPANRDRDDCPPHGIPRPSLRIVGGGL